MTRPTSITDHRASGFLEIVWSDGLATRSQHAALRARCRCGGCEKRRRSGNPDDAVRLVRIVAIKPVGDIGLNLVFSDGHERGIYPWDFLRELCQANLSDEPS